MIHLKTMKAENTQLSEFSGLISSKQNGSIAGLTKLVLIISVLLAVLMLVSK